MLAARMTFSIIARLQWEVNIVWYTWLHMIHFICSPSSSCQAGISPHHVAGISAILQASSFCCRWSALNVTASSSCRTSSAKPARAADWWWWSVEGLQPCLKMLHPRAVWNRTGPPASHSGISLPLRISSECRIMSNCQICYISYIL